MTYKGKNYLELFGNHWSYGLSKRKQAKFRKAT